MRVHSGDSLVGLPLYLPEDKVIPAEGVSSPEGTFERQFVDETKILQRELKDDVPGYLATIAYSIVGLIVLSIIALLGWVLVRLGRLPALAQPSPSSVVSRPRPERRVAVGAGREAAV